MTDPLCGRDWLDHHRGDHTQEEIDNLGIDLSCNGKLQGRVRSGEKKARSIVQQIIKANK